MILRSEFKGVSLSMVMLILVTAAGGCSGTPEKEPVQDPNTLERVVKVAELRKSEEIIPLMPDDYLKVGAYLELAELNEVMGERLNAQKLIQEAQEVLNKIEIENCRKRWSFFLETARIQIVMRNYEEAFDSIQNAVPCLGEEDLDGRDRILEKIAGHFLVQKMFEEALEVAVEINSEKYRHPLVLQIIDQKLSHRQVEEAVLLAESSDPAMKVASLVHLAESMAEVNSNLIPSAEMLNEASGVIETINDPFEKTLKLLLLARAQYDVEGPDAAKQQTRKAEAVLKSIEEDSYSEVLLHWALATTQIRIGDSTGAIKTLDSLVFPSDRAIGLLIVSLERGSALDAVDFMGMAVPAVEEQGDNFWKGFVFQTIAVALIKKGLWIGTPVQLQRAEEYYSLVQNETGRKKTILNLAKILSEQVALLKNAEDADAAAAVLMKTERGKDNIPLNKAYKSPEGGKVFSGMDTVLLLERESERVLALSYIARNLTIGDQADRAFKLASIWDDPLIRFIVFANIAKGRILTVQDPKRNLLKILEGK